MPAVLDRCVVDLQKQGVSESSAFAICTRSLQRAGRLKAHDSRKRDRKEFREFAKQVSLPAALKAGMERSFPEITGADRALLRQLRRVLVTDREGVFGFAKLHSRIISINPTAIKRMGDAPIWYGAIFLHEAIHANKGFGEHEATQIEQRFSGNGFGTAKIGFLLPDMRESIRVAAMAQGQREIQVARRLRGKDFRYLVEHGFTPKMARKVLLIGSTIGDRMREIHGQSEAAKFDGALFKQFLVDFPQECEDFVEKTATEEFGRMLLGAYGDDEVLKEEGGSDYAVDGAHLDGSLGHQRVFEEAVRESVARGIGFDHRTFTGIVPEIRRNKYIASGLPVHTCARRDEVLRDLISTASTEGLYHKDGTMTDSHVLMVMNGFSPILDKIAKEAVNDERGDE